MEGASMFNPSLDRLNGWLEEKKEPPFLEV